MTCPNCAKPVPEGAAECPSCGLVFAKLKARSAVRPARSSESSSWGLTAALLALLCGGVFAAYKLMERGAEPESDVSGVVLRPDAYRRRLQALEKVLYGGSPATAQDARFLSDAAVLMAGAILERNPGDPFAASAAGDFMEFSVAAGAAAEDEAALKDARADWTRHWEALRGRRFERAPWFHAAVSAGPAGPEDLARTADRILESGRRLEALVAALSPELEAFGPGGVDPAALDAPAAAAADPFSPYGKESKAAAKGDPKAPERRRLEAWRAWVPEWQGRVDRVLAGIPSPGTVPDKLSAPYDLLLRSAREARRPPDPGKGALHLPDKTERDAWAAGLAERLSKLPASLEAAQQ